MDMNNTNSIEDELSCKMDDINLNHVVIDLNMLEDMMNRFTRNQKNYLDFVLFVRRVVPYIEQENKNVIITEEVRRLL